MASQPRTAPQSDQPVAPIPKALAAVGSIAATLATGGPLDEIVPDVLGSVRRVLGAEECGVWLHGPDGMRRAWSTDASSLGARDVERLIAAGAEREGPLVVARLGAAGRRLGALVVRVERELDPEDRAFLSTVGNLLAPTLRHAEQSQQLELEVKLRTQQIEEQRRFTEKIIDSLPVGLYVIDREYRIHAWNRKRETGMQGVSREEAIGRTIFEILHRQPAELLRGEFDDVFASGRIQQFQIESEATGDVRTYRISKIPMRLDDAGVTHVITIGEDVTEWREAEERFAQAEKLAAIGTLAAGVMHEINNPLATIAACAESLQLKVDDARQGKPAGPDEYAEYLKIIESEVTRCKHIVDGLLDFSRPKPATRTVVNPNAVIERTLFLLKHHTRFKRLTVHQELDPAVGDEVVGNPEQLVQVFMALLLNAMDAMGDQGTVTLRTRRVSEPAPLVVAEVIDQGHGIRRKDMGKLFEPFYTTKPPGRGTGLGLSICYGIIADHGGRIEVDSVHGKGSTFRIILPSGTTS